MLKQPFVDEINSIRAIMKQSLDHMEQGVTYYGAARAAFDSLNIKLDALEKDRRSVEYATVTPEMCKVSSVKEEGKPTLTLRGEELLYRWFDQGGSVRSASLLFNISYMAARYRHGRWVSAGGAARTKRTLAEDRVH